MDITPLMNWATGRKTEMRFTAKLVLAERVLNFSFTLTKSLS